MVQHQGSCAQCGVSATTASWGIPPVTSPSTQLLAKTTNDAAEHSGEQGLEWIQQGPMIMKTDDLILEIQSLPVEERTRIAECILRSLNPTVSEVDQRWADLAAKRLQEIQAGAIKPVAGDQVFGKIWRRLN